MSKMPKCQHNVNKKESTVVLSKRLFMTNPPTREGVCLVCDCALQYRQKKDKLLLLKEDSNV